MPRVALLASLLLATLPTPAPCQSPVPKAPPGFTVELVLAAPDVESPTALAVAPNGDVYFAEDPMDMGGPPTKNIDKIWLLPGGDPKRKVLFADKMWAVMGLEVVRDKLYCVHPPHVTVFTLGTDGKAAGRKELFDDLGPKVAGVPSFNDHVCSGIRMGGDGWLYVSIGDKGVPRMTRKETDQGSWHVAEGRWRHSKEGHHVSLEGGGVLRFRPDGSGLEVFASGTRNHLDVPLDEHDRVFVRDNTDDGLGWNTRLMFLPRGGFLGYPWAYKHHTRDFLPPITDFGGGSPCGGYVYLDDGLPEEYRGRVFHCEWGKGKVFAVRLAEKGAGFAFADEIPFLDPVPTGVKDFRPFTLRPTADGRGFYVTDWGFSGWSAPVKAGRIFKVTYTGTGVKPAPRGKNADGVAGLLAALDHPAYSERLRAQRALQALPADARVAAACRDPKTSARALRRLVWVAGEDAYPLADFLKHADASVRLEAVRRAGQPGRQALLEDRLAHDADPRVRLQAAAGLGDAPGSAPALVRALRGETDATVRHAITQSLQRLVAWKGLAADEKVLRELVADGPPIDGLPEALAETFDPTAVALLKQMAGRGSSAERAAAVTALASNHKDRKPYAGGWWGTQPARQQPPPREVAWEGTAAVRDAVLAGLTAPDAAVRRSAAAALVRMNDPETLEPLARAFAAEKEPATRADVVRAAAGLNTPRKVPFLAGVLGDGEQPLELRQEALAGLEKAATPEAAGAVQAVATRPGPAGLRARALAALGAMKAAGAKDALSAALGSDEPAVRAAAAGALGQLGDVKAAAVLIPRTRDDDAGVRSAAIQALGALRAREAIPALLEAAGREATQFDAVRALAGMPDRRALAAYLTGLGSKNAELRAAARQALAEVREAVLPDLEQLVKRGEVGGAVLPELRAVYATHDPVLAWHLVGPFPRDAAAPPGRLDPEKSVEIAGKTLKWRSAAGDAKRHGRVDLAALFGGHSEVAAYARAEVESAEEREAELLLGSDDTLTVWVNGERAYDFQGSRAWEPNQARARAKLKKGKNAILVRCGNHSGPWEFSLAVSSEAGRYAFLKGGARKLEPADFRAFAGKNKGDAARGERLFRDVKGLACIKCHAVGGSGGGVGPDLAGIALKYARDDLMTSVLEPSKVIAQGYETVIVTTTAGRTLTGVFKGETGDAVVLADADGKQTRVLKKNVEEKRFSPLSLMPTGLSEGMTLQDFADLIAYLEARREGKGPKK